MNAQCGLASQIMIVEFPTLASAWISRSSASTVCAAKVSRAFENVLEELNERHRAAGPSDGDERVDASVAGR